MMNKNNPRRSFLKNVSLAIGSFVVFSGFQFKKTANVEKQQFSGLSKSEIDEIIKGGKFPGNIKLKPKPAPKGRKNI